MADRTIVARLRAEASQFLPTMGKAAKATEQVGTAAEKASKKATGAFDRMAKSVRDNSKHIDRLGTSAIIAGGAITAGLGLGIKAFADFDEAMSSVNAALPEAGAQMESLRKLAIDLGKDTKFSSTEAAQGITELGKAGLDAQDILGGGLKGSLDLAAAGQLDVARAAEVSATALKQFNLEGSDLGHVADLYAAAAGKAQGSVEDIAQAMKFAGVTANGLGISLDETVGTLGLFAEAGIIGEQAGTSLRSLLLSLTSPSEVARKAMADLGIEMYDQNKNFIGIGGAAEQLKTKLGPLDDATRNAALGQIFGNESINAARKLYEGGAKSVDAWTKKVDDAGFAARQAAALTDNLKGDIERLGGALDAVFVQNGEGTNGALRGLTQGLEGAVEGFGRLPEPAQQTALGLAAITGAGLLTAGMFAKAVTTGADMLESLTALRAAGPKAAKGVDVATKAAKGFAVAMVAAAAIAAASRIGEEGALGADTLTRDLLNATNSVDALDASIGKLQSTSQKLTNEDVNSFGDTLRYTFDPGLFSQVDNAIQSFGAMVGILDTSAITRSSEQLDAIGQSLAGLVQSGNADEAARIFSQMADAAAEQGISVEDLRAKFPPYTEALAAADTQQKNTAGSAKDVAGGIEEVKTTAEQAKTAIDDLAEAIRGFGDTAISADEAKAAFEESADAFEERLKKRRELQKELKAEESKKGEERDPEAIRKLKDELKDYALTLDDTTTAGRANGDMLRKLAEDGKEMSATTLEQTGSTDKAKEAMQKGRDEFVKSAIQMGATKKEAEKLADKYGLIPGSVTTTVKANGLTTTREKVEALITAVELLNRTNATVGIRYVVTGRLPNGGRNLRGGQTANDDNADGGMYRGHSAGMVRTFADGGTIGGNQPQIAKAGGAGILWAEEGAGPWEAFISGHPAKRNRSRSIASDTVERLGGRVEWRRFADGGFAAGGPTIRSEEFDQSLHAEVVNIQGDPNAWRRSFDREKPLRAKGRPGR